MKLAGNWGQNELSPLIERTLETDWLKRAKALGAKWPRVKALFGAIAEDWKSQAKWHDEDAQKMRIRCS